MSNVITAGCAIWVTFMLWLAIMLSPDAEKLNTMCDGHRGASQVVTGPLGINSSIVCRDGSVQKIGVL